MAVVTGTVHTAFGFTTPIGPCPTSTISSVEYEILGCYVTVTAPAGTYASADDFEFTPATVIQNTLDNGKTVTPIAACYAAPGDENGAIVHASGTVTNTSGTFKAQLNQEDTTTEHADGAMNATWNRPLCFYVTFRQKAGG